MSDIIIETLKKYAWKEPEVISEAICEFKKLEHLKSEMEYLKSYFELKRGMMKIL